jgi:hypothetical protein
MGLHPIILLFPASIIRGPDGEILPVEGFDRVIFGGAGDPVLRQLVD